MARFDSPDARRRLAAAIDRWVGTPFRHGGRVAGAGADCINLVLGIYHDAGWVVPVTMPDYYSLDEGNHRKESPVAAWLNGEGWNHFINLGADLPAAVMAQSGDLIMFRFGRCAYHLGVVARGWEFVHAIRGWGVIVSRYDDSTYADRITGIWRPR